MNWRRPGCRASPSPLFSWSRLATTPLATVTARGRRLPKTCSALLWEDNASRRWWKEPTWTGWANGHPMKKLLLKIKSVREGRQCQGPVHFWHPRCSSDRSGGCFWGEARRRERGIEQWVTKSCSSLRRMFLSEEARHGNEKAEKKMEQSVRKEVNITDGQSCSSVRNAAEGKWPWQ